VDGLIHKVLITEEATFDYENCLVFVSYPEYNFVHAEDYDPKHADEIREHNIANWQAEEQYEIPLVRIPKMEIKRELEEFIQNHSTIKNRHYFYTQHYDEQLGWMVLFVKKATRISIMQNWEVVGICRSMDWDEDSEEEGRHRAWYSTKLSLSGDYYDWVQAKRTKEELDEKWNKEIENDQIEYERLFGTR